MLSDRNAYYKEEIIFPWHQEGIKNLANLTIELPRNALILKILHELETSNLSSSAKMNNQRIRRKKIKENKAAV